MSNQASIKSRVTIEHGQTAETIVHMFDGVQPVIHSAAFPSALANPAVRKLISQKAASKNLLGKANHGNNANRPTVSV